MAGLTLGSLQGFYFRFNNSPFSSVADSEMITCQLSRTALSHNLSVPTFSINLPFFSIFSILDFGYFSRRLFRRVTQAVGVATAPGGGGGCPILLASVYEKHAHER